MILVESSVWVEYDRATGSSADTALTELIRNGGDELAVSEPILMEVLAGAVDDTRMHQLRRLLTSFQWIPVDPVADFEGASKIYRACRRAGFTPRGLIDCMIANVAIRGGHELLTTDRDFVSMATVVPLRIAG